MRKNIIIASIILPVLFAGCYKSNSANLVHLQIVNRNGYTKTISDKDELQKYEHLESRASSGHEKIIRVYDIEDKGVVTLYHENGLLWQYIETKKGRAHGLYEEYYSSGKLKIKSHVLEGTGDLTDEAKTSWVFDKMSTVYDEQGNTIAEIPYSHGTQESEATYYYADGSVKMKVPYNQNRVHGQKRGYNQSGDLILFMNYIHGKCDGESFSKGSDDGGAFEQVHKDGRLLHGKYYNVDGSIFSEVLDGDGIKPTFKEGHITQTEEYVNGEIEGDLCIYRADGSLENKSFMKDGIKNGEEIFYYKTPKSSDPLKKLSIMWRGGEIHGKVLSWYPNGVMESEKEMCDHKREGTHICWYLDSSLMMIEEYHEDSLVNGKYFRKGDNVPISRVIDGVGNARIYDKEGILLRKVSYYNGQPAK